MHMNPPLSYFDPSQVGNLNVIAGITPVSRGGDSIGGTVAVDTAPPEYSAGSEPQVHGNIEAFHRTNGVASGGSASLAFTTRNLRIGYTGSYVNANDYKDGSGSLVASTFYEAQNNALEASARAGNQLFTLGIGYQNIPQQGFPDAFMDMTGNEANPPTFTTREKFSKVTPGRTPLPPRKHAAFDGYSQGQGSGRGDADVHAGRKYRIPGRGGDSAVRGRHASSRPRVSQIHSQRLMDAHNQCNRHSGAESASEC